MGWAKGLLHCKHVKEGSAMKWAWYRNEMLMMMVGVVYLLTVGCVAQQADVARIKRDLDAKIAKLDQSKIELQQAVTEANQALEKANTIIAQQRTEIKDLLHSRADLMNQVTTLKEGDLLEVRGEVEQNLHHLQTTAQQLETLKQDVKAYRKEAADQYEGSRQSIKQLQDRIGSQEEVMTAQVAKDEEFRTSLIKFQQALSSLRAALVQQEVKVKEVSRRMDGVTGKQATEAKLAARNFEEVKNSINSVASALERISKNLTDRVDEQDRRLTTVSQTIREDSLTPSTLNQRSQDVQQLAGSVSQLQEALNLVSRKIGERVDAHEEELARLNGRPGRTVAIDPNSSSAGTSNIVVTRPSSEKSAKFSKIKSVDAATQAYQGYYASMQGGDLNGALTGFADFVRRYPRLVIGIQCTVLDRRMLLRPTGI